MKVDMGADEFVPPLTVVVKVTPKVINLRSKGGWIICTVQFPDEHSVSNVDTETVVLNEQIRPMSCTTDEKANNLVVKFDRGDTEVQQLIGDSEGEIPLTITGELIDGTKFAGSDIITVLKKGK
jgi:hypothetical protein